MNESENIITIKILDREYNIKCPAHEAQDLQSAAQLLDEQMRKIRSGGNINSTDRVAVVAALNVCNELMSLKRQGNERLNEINNNIQNIKKRIKNYLAVEEEFAV